MKALKIALLLSALLLLSCASRNKHKERSETIQKFQFSVDTSYSFRNKLQFQNTLHSYSAAQFQNLSIAYEGNENDSISVEQYGPDGKLLQKTKIKGKGKANLNQASGASREETTTRESGHSEQEGKASGHKEAKGENSTATLDEHIRTWYFPWWLWLVLILIAIGAGYKLWQKYGFHVTRLFKTN